MMGIPRRRRNRGRRRRINRAAGGRKVAGHGDRAGVGSLPGDLLIDVLGRVASSSFIDLFNAKLCCRDFLSAAENEYIFQNISIDKFPVVHWFPPSDEVLSFLNSCKDRGNPEALFRQGMIECFSSGRGELGLEYLKKATEKGHIEATYVYGIILLSKGGQSSQEGLKLLNSVMNNPRLESRKIRDCRARINDIIRTMWIDHSIVRRQVNPACTCHEREKTSFARKVGGSWNYTEEDEVISCDTCRWNREVVSFCKMLRGID